MNPTKPMNPDLAEKVYDILVDVCGAREGERKTFVAQQSTDAIGEWRFCGTLGFGGKLRREENGMYVYCYREDMNAEREAVINEANRRLTQI